MMNYECLGFPLGRSKIIKQYLSLSNKKTLKSTPDTPHPKWKIQKKIS